MARKQTPPFSVQIELNEGCNLGCSFCGLQGMKKNGKTPWNRMSRATAKRIASELERLGWHSRIIFSMHGEPTLNPDILKVIKMFRKKLPTSVFSLMTNGYGIVHGFGNQEDDGFESITDRVQALFDAGLNDLIVDYYSTKGDAATIEEELVSRNKDEGYEFNLQHLQAKVPLYGNSHKKQRVLFNPPIQKEGAINRHLCNHCGAAGPLDMSYQGKRCARPFRELSLRYDGSVAICCNDFRGEYPIGNVMEMALEEIWYSKRFEAARILLYAGQRTFVPCLGCNALSHRVGLLPDLTGKEDMPEPNKRITQFAQSVAANNDPLCGEVQLRPWETREDK